MKKSLKITIVAGSLFMAFMAGGLISTQITSMQNREIWNKVLTLIETVDLIKKTTPIN
jgi:hypothetical protein